MWKSWEYFSDSLIFNSTSNNHIQAPHLFLFLINKDQHDVWWQGGSCRVSALSYYKRHLRLFESMLIASDWRFVQPAGDLRMDRELSGEIIYHRNSWGETGNTLDGWFVYLNVDLYIKYLFLVSPTQVSFTHDPPLVIPDVQRGWVRFIIVSGDVSHSSPAGASLVESRLWG